jgi:glycosyltransferase involved in cell wall biosynthesis
VKILFVHQKAGFQGGAEANVYQVARAFAERGHEAGIVYGESAEEVLIEEFLEPFVLSCRYSDGKRSFGRALETAQKWQPDVVYVHKLSNNAALEQLLYSGLPLVRMVHDHDMYCQRTSRYFPWNRKICTRKAGYGCVVTCGVVRNRGGRIPFKLAWPGDKLREIELCRQFPTQIVQTDYMRDELLLHDFPESSIEVIPVAPQQDTSFVKKDFSSRGILFVGQIIRGKGVDFLVRALDKIRDEDWHCTIAGVGAHQAHCENLSKELGLSDRIRFAGRLDRNLLLEEYERARVGVVPSVWPEPMGMVGLEFMWAGMPCVGFDAGGIGHWLRDNETGFLAPALDVDAMADGIKRLLDDESLARQMGEHARKVAEKLYNFDDYISRLLHILNDASHTTHLALTK